MAIRLPANADYIPSARSMASYLFDSKASLQQAAADAVQSASKISPVNYQVIKERLPDHTFKSLLQVCTVSILKDIHQQNQFQLPVSQRKANLIDSLIIGLPIAWQTFLDACTPETAAMLLKICSQHVLHEPRSAQEQCLYQYLLKCGFAYAIDDGSGRMVLMPDELLRSVADVKKPEKSALQKQNSLVCQMGKRLLEMIGIMPQSDCLRYLDELTCFYQAGQLDQKVSLDPVMRDPFGYRLKSDANSQGRYAFMVYAQSSLDVDLVTLADHHHLPCLCHPHVISPHELYLEQLDRKDLSYPECSCRDLLRPRSLSQELDENLIRYLERNKLLNRHETGHHLAVWTCAVRNGETPVHLFSWLFELLTLSSTEMMNETMNYLNLSYMNKMPLWPLKGHCSQELMQNMTQTAAPLIPGFHGTGQPYEADWPDDGLHATDQAEPYAGVTAVPHLNPAVIEAIKREKSSVEAATMHPPTVSTSTNRLAAAAAAATSKPGRNDPCPCGSGKKYKKCCGN